MSMCSEGIISMGINRMWRRYVLAGGRRSRLNFVGRKFMMVLSLTYQSVLTQSDFFSKNFNLNIQSSSSEFSSFSCSSCFAKQIAFPIGKKSG